MQVGERVSFLLSYGPPKLRIRGGELRWFYGQQRRTGTIEQVIASFGVVIIRVDDAPRYDSLIGLPIAKVTKIKEARCT